MRALMAGLLLLTAVPVLAAQPPVPPAEQKGDPKPDTKAAQDFLKAGRYEDAIRQAKLALGRDERYVPAMLVLAKAYYYQHKYELASSIVDIAKSVDDKNAECYNLLGFIALSRDDRISATAAFKKATELDPNYGNAWDNLTAQYLHAKNYEGALAAAQKATQLLPTFAKAWLNLGSAYRGMQDYAKAKSAYERALQLDPKYDSAYFNLGILFLDAKEMPGTDTLTKFSTAINYLNQYKQIAGYRLAKNDPADIYIKEAQQGMDREQHRLKRLQRQKTQEKAQQGANGASTNGKPTSAPASAAPKTVDRKAGGK